MEWHRPRDSLDLEAGYVHLWQAALDGTAGRVHALRQILADDERCRADRLDEQTRRRFTMARGLLRTILARYLAIEPCALRFSYGPNGKPALASAPGGADVQFNLAHSHELALYAVTLGRRVGVDIERIRRDFAAELIAERFFTPTEIAALRSTPDDSKPQAFFKCWTRKEAYIKATGAGIWQPLDHLDTALTRGKPTASLRTRKNPEQADRWSLREIDVGPGYAAALAVEGHGWRLKCWHCPAEPGAPA